jgi:hypothetical protein
MKNEFVIGAIIIFLFLSFGGIKFYTDMRERDKIQEFIDKEYRLLLINDSINSVVLSTYYPQGWRAGTMIQNVKFIDGNNYKIKIRTNITSREMYFGNLVKPGVVLKKSMGSDTLNLIKGYEVYQFLIFGK